MNTSERRKEARLRSLVAARACFNERRSTLDCVIRNMSTDGALLEFSDVVPLPARFELEIPQQQRFRPATVCWHKGRRYGVLLDHSVPPDDRHR